MAGYHNARVTNRQRATFVNGLNKISEKERGGDCLFVLAANEAKDCKEISIYIYICIRLKIVERIEDIGLEKYLSFSKGC